MSTQARLNPQAFAQIQLHLIGQEQQTEVAENQLLLSSSPPAVLARVGLAVLNLTVQSLRTGLGGRTVVELGLDPAVTSTTNDLPAHGIRTGDIVRVSEQPKGSAKKRDVEALRGKGVEGVVTRVGERAVWVAVGKEGAGGSGEDAEVPDGKLWLVKLANDVTYRRMTQTITKLSKLTDSDFTSLQRVLLGISAPGSADFSKAEHLSFINLTINDSQKSAIRHALTAPEISLIHGPPGTGKTATVIELILQILQLNPSFRILVCGPSNISVDNIVERLASLPTSLQSSDKINGVAETTRSAYKKPTFTRLGHPARLLPSILSHSLEVLTKSSESAAIVQDIRTEMDTKQSSIRKTKSRADRRAIYQDLRELRKEFRQRENRCISEVIRTSQVVCSTLHGAGGRQLFGQTFDVVIVDEAAQALEAQCWIPILGVNGVKKLILAGDHLQLPPTIKSTNEKVEKKDREKSLKLLDESLRALALSDAELTTSRKTSLSTTMFDRLLSTHGPSIKTLLTTQYRMHESISRFPSIQLYDSKLLAHDSVKSHLLTDLPHPVLPTDDTTTPLVFYDTQGGDFPETIPPATNDASSSPSAATPKSTPLHSDSKSNPNEARLVLKHVRALTAAGVPEADIAVITPYTAQLALLSALLREAYPALELGSVDGFQGREKEAVVLSLVRSNVDGGENRSGGGAGEVGFLAEKRRLNVAMTRARRHLCVIGDSETVGGGGGGEFLKAWMKFLEENADLRYATLDDIGDGGG